jgi:hypothetical protein
MGIAALLIAAIVIAAVVVGGHLLFGQGPTAAAAPTPTSAEATLPAIDVPTGSPVDVLGLAEACASVPSGQVPPGLDIASTTTGIGTDPVAGYSNPYISVRLAETIGSGTPPFSLIAVILPFGSTAPASTPLPKGASPSPAPSALDRAGTMQLIAYWDGTRWVGALRIWSGSVWALTVDAGSGVDTAQVGSTVTIYSQGLTAGDKYGVIVATSAGCADQGMTPALVPDQTFAIQPSP